MRVICTSCGEMIPGTDFDLRKSVAVCRPCGEVVALPTAVRDGEGNAVFLSKEIANVPLHAYRPIDMRWNERKSGLRFHFELRPPRGTAFFVVLFAIIWNSFLVSWFSFALTSGRSTLGAMAFWFPLLHLGAGAVFLHTAVCMLVNHAELSLSPMRFTFTHKPLWQPGTLSEPTRLIRCAVDQEQIAKGVKERWFRRNVTYSVTLLFRDGRAGTLSLYLPDKGQARYLALRLNRALDEIRAAEPAEPERPQPADPHEARGKAT